MLFKYLKFFIFLSLGLIICYISHRYGDQLGQDIVNFLLFPASFILVNYAFIKLILGQIKFYNDLLIIYKGELIVIKSSLLMKDNTEFIDINKITKVDTYCRGLIPNVLGYGMLVAEQQRDEVRTFHFVPEPFKALQILNEEKQKVLEEQKKAYVVDEKK